MRIQVSRRRREKQSGFSLMELIVVIAIIALILMFAVPKFSQVTSTTKEKGAMEALQTIQKAEVLYQSIYNKFATSLTQLGPPAGAGGVEGPEAANLIPGTLANGEASSYHFTLTATTTGFAVSAVPKVFGTDGHHTFYMDESGVIRQNRGQEPATATSPEAAAGN